MRNAIKIMDHAARVIQHAMLDHLFRKRQERLDASDYEEEDYEEDYVEDIEEEEQEEDKVNTS